jgi:hypothetical protein
MNENNERDEEVVDREALLDDVTGEVLRAGVTAVGHREPDAERDGHADVEHRPRRCLTEPDAVRAHHCQYEVERQQRDDQNDRQRPREPADLHRVFLHTLAIGITDGLSNGGGASAVPPSPGRAGATSPVRADHAVYNGGQRGSPRSSSLW